MAHGGVEPTTASIDESDRLTYTWGKEGFQPVKYHGFDIGPFTVTVTLRPGETVKAAYVRARVELAKVAELEFETKLPEYLERIRRVRDEVKRQASE